MLHITTNGDLFCGMSVNQCAKMAERIEVLFGVETPGKPRHIILDEGPQPPVA